MATTYEITKQASKPDIPLRWFGARLDVTIGEVTPSSDSSSSSSQIAFPSVSSSSAVAGVDYDLFLYQRIGTRDYFIGVCSPQDLDTWPSDMPDATTGYYRTSVGSWTFRVDTLLDEFWTLLLTDLQTLATALGKLELLVPVAAVPYAVVTDEGSDTFTVTKAVVAAYPTAAPVGYRMTITCTTASIDAKIFLHRNDMANRDMDVHSRPIAVCSPGDLVDYPADAPDSNDFPQHYRKATFDIVSKNLDALTRGWADIKSNVRDLAAALTLHTNTVTETDTLQVSTDG